MSTRATKPPALHGIASIDTHPSVKRLLQSMTESLQLSWGQAGDPLDRHVTLRELKDIGLVKAVSGKIAGTGAAVPGSGEPGAPLVPPGDPDFGTDDYTTPPTPTGVRAIGVPPNNIMVSWNPPTYRNHAYTEVFAVALNPSFDAMIGLSPGFDRSKPAGSLNVHAAFAGAAAGSQFMHRDLVRLIDPNASEVDNALNPTIYYYWVRFVSNAGVVGPFHTTGAGAAGQLSIDEVAALDAMVTNVTSTALYARLRQVISLANLTEEELLELGTKGSVARMSLDRTSAVRQDLTTLQGQLGDTAAFGVNETLSEVALRNDQTIENLWTVRMRTTIGGTTYAAGFGLGLTVDAVNGTKQSSFIVNADQFAIVGIDPNASSTETAPPVVPFIVDTVRKTVGIRGNLIVDGLVRASAADVTTLVAGTAFMDQVRAETLRAQLVIGNQIIAGDTEGDQGGFRVELNNPKVLGPGAGAPPMRYWNPTTGQTVFQLDLQGNVALGGHLSVGQNAVIGTTGTNVASFGGAGADGDYALWIGPRATYGTKGEGRTEAAGLLWVKDNGRAGLNASFFLGADPFGLPSLAAAGPGAHSFFAAGGARANALVQSAVSAKPITIRAARDATLPPPVIVIVSAFLMSINESSGSNGDDKQMRVYLELVGSNSAAAPAVAQLQVMEFDDWTPETMPLTMIGSATLPAGNYYVRLRIEHLQDRRMSIMDGWNVVAFQAASNAALL